MKPYRYLPALFAVLVLVASCTDSSGNLNEGGVFLLVIVGVFAVLIGALVIALIRTNRKTKARQESAIRAAISENQDFSASKVYKGDGTNSYYLAIDDSKEKVLYVFDTTKVLCDFKDIVAVEIIEDGEVTTSSKSVAGTVGGAIIGGVVAGGVGAIVGGMTGKSTSHSQILSLKVHVLIRNQPVQSFDILCYSGDGNVEKFTYIRAYEAASKRARDLFDMFKLIIDKSDVNESIQERNTKSTVEELKELAELHEKGVISDDEFSKMKQRIIGKE